MKSIIKKLSITLFLSLQIPITCLSQVTFDSIEVKEIAIIFAEHQKLTIENPLLKEEINSLEKLNQLYVKTDSIQKAELEEYNNKVISDKETIQKLKSTQKKTVFGALVSGMFLFILGLLL